VNWRDGEYIPFAFVMSFAYIVSIFPCPLLRSCIARLWYKLT